jgi:hypothetical protein
MISTQALSKSAVFPVLNVKSTLGDQETETVKALVTFNNGKNKIPVDCTLVYKSVSGNYQITEETWKIVQL